MAILVAVQSRIRVELVWDDSTRRWDFDVPSLDILGTGGPTREAALRRAAEAIAVALDGDETLEPGAGEVAFVPVAIGG